MNNIVTRYLAIREELRGNNTADLSLVASNILIAEVLKEALLLGAGNMGVSLVNGDYPFGVRVTEIPR